MSPTLTSGFTLDVPKELQSHVTDTGASPFPAAEQGRGGHIVTPSSGFFF